MTDLLERDSAVSGRPRIDPRIAQRWIEARREEGRRRLRALVVVGAVVACLALAFGSLYTPLFRVRHVRITVAGPLSTRAVGRLAGVTTRTQTIDVDTAAIAARLDADPRLGAAHVTRHWPGTVTISVAVRSPLAVVALGSQRPAAVPGGPPGADAGQDGATAGAVAAGFAEVDATGRVLADVTAPPPGTPVLRGFTSVPAPGGWLPGTAGPSAAPGSPAGRLADMTAASDGPDVPSGAAAALAIVDALPPLLRADVTSVTAAGHGLSLVVSPPRMAVGDVTVLLGDGSQLQAKVTALVTILSEGDLSGVAGLDLTVPSRPATASTVAGLSPSPAGTGPAATGNAATSGAAASNAAASNPGSNAPAGTGTGGNGVPVSGGANG